jgi:hypothetical protein
VKTQHTSNGDGPNRIAMISTPQGDELGSPRLRCQALAPILKGDLHRHFDGARPVTTKEDMFQSSRSQSRQSLGKLNGNGMTHPQIRDMGYFVQLITNRLIDRRMPVSVHVAPKGAGSVKKSSTMYILQPATFGRLNDKTIIVRHLRERMPNDSAI